MKNGLKECDGGDLGIKHMNPVLAPSIWHTLVFTLGFWHDGHNTKLLIDTTDSTLINNVLPNLKNKMFKMNCVRANYNYMYVDKCYIYI